MPIYEYQCTQCEHVVEKLVKIDDEEIPFCAECGQPMNKLISLSTFKLNGKWFKTEGSY